MTDRRVPNKLAMGREMVREKNLFEVKDFSFESMKIDILKKSLEIFNYNNADLKKNEMLIEGQSEWIQEIKNRARLLNFFP